jgi:hypothetical protein
LDVKKKVDLELVNNKKKNVNKSSMIESNSENLDFYEKFALSTKSVSLQLSKNLKRILIIGKNLIATYNSIQKAFPNAQYIVANESKEFLSRFIENIDSNINTKIKILNLFDGSSLTDFYLEFGKFDLIILSGIFNDYDLSKKRKNNSILFLYKHFLNFDGIFSILDNKKELSDDFIKKLKRLRFFKKSIKSHQQKDSSLQYLIFTKKHRLKLFGD